MRCDARRRGPHHAYLPSTVNGQNAFRRSSHHVRPRTGDWLSFAERQDGTMTFVGKILVIVIMVFALFFLAVSVVTFSTAKNWKDETAKLKKNIGDLQKKVADANNDVNQRKG